MVKEMTGKFNNFVDAFWTFFKLDGGRKPPKVKKVEQISHPSDWHNAWGDDDKEDN